MDEILSKASNQAVSFAIRSGISLASGYAIKTITKLVDKIPEQEKAKIIAQRRKIQLKIEIINNSIELIKVVTATGYSCLESTVELIDDLTEEFNRFDETIESIVVKLSTSNSKTNELVSQVNRYMAELLDKINEAVPLLNLSIITSGVDLSRNLSHRVSINKLIQASNYVINSCQSQPSEKISTAVGPEFDLKFYSVFYNPSRLKYHESAESSTKPTGSPAGSNSSIDGLTWKEEYARSKITIRAVAPFSYKLEILESFDDDRYHESTDTPQSRVINLSDIKKLFFSMSGELLKLDNNSSPVLILKLSNDEYIALGELNPKDFDDSDEGSDSENEDDSKITDQNKNSGKSINKEISNKLSLLEYLIRLTVLQQIDRKCVTDITDERLSIYLNNELLNSTLLVPEQTTSSLNDALDLNSNIKRLENLNL